MGLHEDGSVEHQRDRGRPVVAAGCETNDVGPMLPGRTSLRCGGPHSPSERRTFPAFNGVIGYALFGYPVWKNEPYQKWRRHPRVHRLCRVPRGHFSFVPYDHHTGNERNARNTTASRAVASTSRSDAGIEPAVSRRTRWMNFA